MWLSARAREHLERCGIYFGLDWSLIHEACRWVRWRWGWQAHFVCGVLWTMDMCLLWMTLMGTRHIYTTNQCKICNYETIEIASQSSGSASSLTISSVPRDILISLSLTKPSEHYWPTQSNAQVDWTPRRLWTCGRMRWPWLKTRSTSTVVAKGQNISIKVKQRWGHTYLGLRGNPEPYMIGEEM